MTLVRGANALYPAVSAVLKRDNGHARIRNHKMAEPFALVMTPKQEIVMKRKHAVSFNKSFG